MASKSEKKAAAEQEPTYGEMEKRMQEILSELSQGSLSLDEQVKLGQEGQELLAKMETKLNKLREKVQSLAKPDQPK